MTIADLPKIDVKDSADPPREGPCWKFILGNCNGGEDCNFVHIPASLLSDEMVEKCLPCLKKVAKGLEQLALSKSTKKKRKRATKPAKNTFGS